jgi:hypothetical protein
MSDIKTVQARLQSVLDGAFPREEIDLDDVRAVLAASESEQKESFEEMMKRDHPYFPLHQRMQKAGYVGPPEYVSAGTQHMFNGWCAAIAASKSSEGAKP